MFKWFLLVLTMIAPPLAIITIPWAVVLFTKEY